MEQALIRALAERYAWPPPEGAQTPVWRPREPATFYLTFAARGGTISNGLPRVHDEEARMSSSEVECYVCGSRFGLPQGVAMPRRCPRCQGTFLAKRAGAPERREDQVPRVTPPREDIPSAVVERHEI